MKCCGMCGNPIDDKGNILPTPENYDPNKYEKDWCIDCGNTYQESFNQITREMAIDAGYPELEGVWIK